MARVNILTFHYANNYGSVLQAYGLVKAIQALGHEATVVDYRPEAARRYYNSHWLRYPISFLRHPVEFSRKTAFRRAFNRFRQDYLPLSRVYSSAAELNQAPPPADCAVCGSDQVWNVASFRGFDPPFFLDLPDGAGRRRISYAATFGNAESMGPHRARIGELLSRFDSLSVRDRKSQQMVQDLIGRMPEHVVDPCFLADFEAITPPPLIREPYIFFYCFKASKLAADVVERLRDRFNIPVVSPGTDVPGVKNRRIGPRAWLSLVRNAQFVCTNSFHGTCFSLINRKPFVLLPNPSGMTRLEDMLSTAGLSNRLVWDAGKLEAVLDGPIDYREVGGRIDQARRHSLEFLRQALS